MTIRGALTDLKNLLNADDIPGYYKPSIKKVIETIEQEPKTEYRSFCEFVAKTVMEEDFEINARANAEIFCRKLADLGIVKADGDMWILESESE